MYKTQIYSLTTCYKHLYNHHPSQEKNFMLKLIQRKIPTGLTVGED